MNQGLKNGLIAFGVVIAIVIALFVIVPISYRNSAAKGEVLVQNAVQDCASTYDNGIKSVIEMAQVDANTKQYLTGLVTSGTLQQNKDTQPAYSQFVNGNAQPLLVLLGAMASTNLTATAENVQREITSQRAQMLTCSKMLNSTQRELRNTLGMDASGRVIAFPQSMLHLDLPSEVNDPTLVDNDNDGKLTVLDYRPPVNVDIRSSFGTGNGIPPVNLYGTQTP